MILEFRGKGDLIVDPAGRIELRQNVPTAGVRFSEKGHSFNRVAKR